MSLVLACWLADVDAATKNARLDAGVVKSNAHVDAGAVKSNADTNVIHVNVDAPTAYSNVDSARADPNVDAPVAGSNVNSAVVHKNVDAAILGSSNVESAAMRKDVDSAAMRKDVDGSNVDSAETVCSSPATTPAAPRPAQNTDAPSTRITATSTAKPCEDTEVSTVATDAAKTGDAFDRLRERVIQLTDALSKAQAKLTVLHTRVHLLTTVEKEKYG